MKCSFRRNVECDNTCENKRNFPDGRTFCYTGTSKALKRVFEHKKNGVKIQISKGSKEWKELKEQYDLERVMVLKK